MIREARMQDAGKIAGIIVATWKDAYTGIIDQDYTDTMDMNRFIRIFEDNIQQKRETIFVYEEDEKIKGFISGKLLNENTYHCETVGFYVLPEFQKQGIGKKLFQHLKSYYFGLTCKKMIVWTLNGAKNNSFYENNGGTIMEKKKLNIGNREYAGIGFVVDLSI